MFANILIFLQRKNIVSIYTWWKTSQTQFKCLREFRYVINLEIVISKEFLKRLKSACSPIPRWRTHSTSYSQLDSYPMIADLQIIHFRVTLFLGILNVNSFMESPLNHFYQNNIAFILKFPPQGSSNSINLIQMISFFLHTTQIHQKENSMNRLFSSQYFQNFRQSNPKNPGITSRLYY